MKKHFAQILLAALSLAIANIGCTESNKEEASSLDILILTLVKDIQDHTLYIQLSNEASSNLYDLLSNNLAMKVFDLNQHLPGTSNLEVVKLACNSAKRLEDDVNEITDQCGNPKSSEVCGEFKKLASYCHSNSGSE